MAETLDRYISLLETIQSTTSAETVSIASDEAEREEAKKHLINIDWNTRAVTLPSAYSQYIGVVSDHRAATVFFSADRYFDSVDLAKLNFSIEFVNAANEGRIYPVVDFDLSEPGKIMFGWKLGYEATKKSGQIQFIVHVYSVDPQLHKYTYSLNTQPCKATVLSTVTMSNNPSIQDMYGMSAQEVEDLFGRLSALEQKAVTWYDLVGSANDDASGNTDVQPQEPIDNTDPSYNGDENYWDGDNTTPPEEGMVYDPEAGTWYYP